VAAVAGQWSFRGRMNEKTLKSKTVFEGRLVRLEVQDVELEDGRTAYREFVRHAPAVAVVARRADGRFLFVRQFRKAVEKLMLEVPAGICEPGEDPRVAAGRELVEETGYAFQSLEKIGRIFPTPGYVDEVIDVYFAEVPAEPGACNPDWDERVELVVFTADEFEASIRRGEVEDGKTLAAWTLYKLKVGPA
jgi:ADP-ribose pyrophosphatase